MFAKEKLVVVVVVTAVHYPVLALHFRNCLSVRSETRLQVFLNPFQFDYPAEVGYFDPRKTAQCLLTNNVLH